MSASNAIWRDVPLHGRVLIEASAGTGKTHQIALLVLRLLLEARQEHADGPAFLGIEQILVCTFTKAAAAELRARIRARLVLAERLLAGAAAAQTEDAELQQWLDSLAVDDAMRELLRGRLRLAILDFDRASISTFHSWCTRVQREQPLASGAQLGQVELIDEARLLDECLEDFLRRCTQCPPAQRPAYAQVLLTRRGDVRQALQTLRNHPGAQLDPPEADVLERWDELIGQMSESATRARLVQQRARLLKAGSAFGRRIDELPDDPAEASYTAFEPDSLAKAKIEKLRDLSTHPEFARLIELRELQARRERVLFAHALQDAHHWCSSELQRRAAARDGQGYSALIQHLHQALSGSAGGELAARLRHAHPHALIDEFQDTDQQQFDIFEHIYTPEHSDATSLHLIGDPKQSIYGFRGGDLAAYLRAARGIESRWSIRTNWRSTQAGVTALNALYSLSAQGGFAHEQIRYEPVQCGHRLAQKPWTDQGDPVEIGLRVWVDPTEASSNMGQQQERVLIACADRIAEVLSAGQWQLGGEAVLPADIAVLAHRHHELQRMRELLIQRGVPCASTGRLSLADAPVAVELQLILEAVLAHDDDGAVRGALSTPLLGLDLAQLDALARSETEWLRQVQRFVHWRGILQRRGVLALIEDLLLERAAQELKHADGERRLTDLRHLGEWLEAQHAGAGATPAQVLSTLRRLREEGLDQTHEQQLRTETDARRVQLLTVFAAKGLQFPVVFLPLLWRASGRDPDAVQRYHADDQSLRLDAGSARFDANSELARVETEAEELRTLYVALTRAMYVSELYWSERAWPPKHDRRTGLELLLIDMGEGQKPHAALAKIAGLPAVEVLAMPEASVPMPRYRAGEHAGAEAAPRQSRSDFPEPRPAFVLHSFSGLTHSRSSAGDTLVQPAADETGPAPAQDPPQADDLLHALSDPRLLALAGQRGMAFGNASHAILERAVVGPLWPAQSELLLQALREQGFAVDLKHPDSAWVRGLARRLDEVRHADLGGGLRLATLKPEQQVREFEFHFPLQGVALSRLRQICARHGQPQLLPPWLEHGRLKGLMTGFIDLVYQHRGRFGVLDYKSNWLGDTLSHYQPSALANAMQAEFYPLQALIYSIALHRYLLLRLPGYDYERHHAGAVYVYLRAAGLEGNSGVYTLRFAQGLIEEFNQALGS